MCTKYMRLYRDIWTFWLLAIGSHASNGAAPIFFLEYVKRPAYLYIKEKVKENNITAEPSSY